MEQANFVSGFCADIEALAAAVICQSGGWETFKENAPDVANHGIDAGFHGWTYYSETIGFFEKNRKEIVEFLINLACEHGFATVEMIGQWRCMEGATAREIASTLSGVGEPDPTVATGMSWCVAEDVSRRFVDAEAGQ